MPQPLSRDELPAPTARQSSSTAAQLCGLAQRRPAASRSFPRSGPAQSGTCSFSKDPGLAPFAARHRHQRTFAQREREIIGRAVYLPDADRILQRRVATIEGTAKDARDPLQERGCQASRSCPPRTCAWPRLCWAAIRSTPRRHKMARSSAAHAWAEGSSGRAPSPYCQRSTASAHRSASTGGAVNAARSESSTAAIGCPSIPPRSSSHRNHR